MNKYCIFIKFVKCDRQREDVMLLVWKFEVTSDILTYVSPKP